MPEKDSLSPLLLLRDIKGDIFVLMLIQLAQATDNTMQMRLQVQIVHNVIGTLTQFPAKDFTSLQIRK